MFHVTLLLQTRCRCWDEILLCNSQDSSLWSSRKSLHGLRFVPTDFTHGVSSSSHDFRIQSHLFTSDSHVCDRVFQAHVNNMWSLLRSYDPHKPMCPKPSLSVPIGYPIVWNEASHLLLLCIFSQQNSDKVQYPRDFKLNWFHIHFLTGILLAMEFLWHWCMQARGAGIMEAVSWLQFPSRSDYFSFIWWLLLSWLPCKRHALSKSIRLLPEWDPCHIV